MKFTSKIDGSIVKKVPVLNTSKHAERMRALQEELKDSNPASNKQSILQSLHHHLQIQKVK